ncbi:LytR cell envelope-related transcriptional attenuator [Bifidobacterium italicum]|uniref:LytR cell envelope-related transcriptional attenuator n=1 Tax=Bifidobacterium italicum TaxID=1960968 RepID=A0A2A2ELH4_9BIFI|nr:LytR C-terminal domain-containing protein [Bifidobacterium italicum]PAU69775.1 LytR cell envelope-related transcriptional attenuator [Bifidobacterium italicum]
MAQNNGAREARKAYVRKRQSIVFGIIGVVLVVALVISTLVFFHVGGLGETAQSKESANYGRTAPCVSPAADGSTPKYVDNRSVTVRVLNGTQFSGFAQAVAEALENREFVVQGVDNYDSSKVERTLIIFGKNAIPQAYTLASNFSDAQMVMDDRPDKLVDVVLGATFKDLVPTEDLPKTGSDIPNIEGCKAPDKMTSLPKAPDHTAVG